ncbi:acyl carrier protein [Apibacter muscae]|uniref:acyl carrier protein n=1 Tax=Apibacter muscae TaxID=2509004 RepID=UPI0011ADAA3A|nr:acyl carrier protein [Apibacter muscae]TWP30956.1 acyl carrier protein [Apibacter muscae]
MDPIEKQKEEVYEQLKKYIIEIIGEDIAEELDISPKSIFTKDLEMDSIEIVSLAEKVKTKYGDVIDFNGWLSEMEMEQLIKLSIEDIVNLIVDALNKDK